MATSWLRVGEEDRPLGIQTNPSESRDIVRELEPVSDRVRLFEFAVDIFKKLFVGPSILFWVVARVQQVGR